eukprot:TRINITY_DN13426_c1_g1_i1.p1 TRINITY_DN13426_c1_g1~~TRINITY_DN13426_c1_g1_i1.p1  ORF type:complete len:598 (+),score=117.81 TRINITY_DN13426_c1_g1_i1:51-1796(+)
MSSSPDYQYDLTGYERSDSKSIWETRGLTWMYGYNHEEAAKCYQKAIDEDPTNLFAIWGFAYSLGPNYNKDWSMFEDEEKSVCYKKSRDMLTKGITLSKGRENEFGSQLLRALEKKYPTDESDYSDETHQTYVSEMKKLYEEHPTDPDIAAIYAESIMGLKPWGLWTRTGEPAIPEALTAQHVLETSISSGIQHPGVYHFYIHLMELSGTPEKSLEVCNKLERLVPDAGHLIHMPSHIYIQVGMYEEALRSNKAAIEADVKAYKNRAAEGDHFYTLYRFHDYHFASWAAMMMGSYEEALKPALEMFKNLDFEVMKNPWNDPMLGIGRSPLADWFEAFLPTYLHVKVRFGKWDEIIADTLVEDIAAEHDPKGEIFTTLRATLSYAQSVAYSAKSGQASDEKVRSELVSKAEAKLADFEAKMKVLVETTPDRAVMNNSASSILNVGRFVARGELKFRQGDVTGAMGDLQTAVTLFDGGEVENKAGLVYDEPWGWMMPARHPLGALSLEANLLDISTTAFEEDLGIKKGIHQTYPNNIWSLLGLKDCYLKQGKDTSELDEKIKEAQQRTDTAIKTACFCHKEAF